MKLNKIFKWGMVLLILVSVALLVWGFVAGFETSTHEALPPTNALLTWAAIMIGVALFCWIVVGLIVSRIFLTGPCVSAPPAPLTTSHHLREVRRCHIAVAP